MSLHGSERARAAGLVAPALARTHAVFLLPFAFMAAMSLWQRTPQGIPRTWTLTH
jgi:spermidine/putrescine transport system permease protein